MNVDADRDWGRFFWGLALIGVGVFLLLERTGGLPGWMYDYSWWGGIVVVWGMGTLVTARRAESAGSGVTLVLLGAWILAVTNRLYGLSWFNSWPLALVAAGAGTLAHAIAANWLPDTRRLRRRLRRRIYIDDVGDPREPHDPANAEGPHA
jgi:hypothetical protein